MRIETELVQKRRNDIMTLIQKFKNISVNELVREFHTSPVTIRRDLQYWEDLGAIQRTHGGAKLIQTMVANKDEAFTNDRYIQAIAKRAALFVEEGDTIFINTSLTALLMIRYIKDKNCTVITNNGSAMTLKHDPKVRIILTGGELTFPKKSMVGDFTISTIQRVIANKCFLGCSGITLDDGITTAIMAETTINELMLSQTQGKKFVVCDHTKFGMKYSFKSGSLDKIDGVITDIATSFDDISALRLKGKDVITVEPLLHSEFY